MNFPKIQSLVISISSLLALAAVACGPQGSYREVKVAQGGGELALEGDRALAHQKAEAYMQTKCAAGYDILEEGEATVGTDTTTSSSGGGVRVRSHGVSFGKRPSSESSTRDATEWRVKYQCKGAAATPAAPAAAAPAPATGASIASPTGERVGEIQEVRVRL